MADPAPFISSVMEVRPEWIDLNNHMNMAYYAVLFDLCADEIYPQIGFGEAYLRDHNHSTYTGEFHICYLRELKLGDKVRVHFQLLDFDDKKFHTYQEIWHEDGWRAACGEALGLHIDMSGPRVAPFPDHIRANLERLKAAHDPLGWPERASRKITLRKG